eukprot:Tbor_TRINITY_DN6101_c0_g3::TRINITY_DN6101_c0_g3_i4::g.21997::m.21997
MFNPFERLKQINQLCQFDDYEWMQSIVQQFKGVSSLQRRAYEVIIQHTLDFLHVIFLEKHHRRYYAYGLSEDMSFSKYINELFSELITWSSMPHFVSLSTATDVPIPLHHGPDDPLEDKVLYKSATPTVLPWGILAPSPSGDSEWFMPHWNDEAPFKVFTTVDFAPVAVWKKQIDYVTYNDQPVWWFSLCPEVGLYVNTQPFIAAGRPLLQDVEGFSPEMSLRSVTHLSRDRIAGWDSHIESKDPLEGTTLDPKSVVSSYSDVSTYGELAKSITINIQHGAVKHSPSSTTFTYNEGLDITVHGWFGVHWNDMERRLRAYVAHDATSNRFHVTAYTIPKSTSGNTNVTTCNTTTTITKDDMNSIQSDPNTGSDNNLNNDGDQEFISIINDSHEFKSCVSYTEAHAAEKVVMTVTNIIPPQKPITARIQSPVTSEANSKTLSRRTIKSSSERVEGRARSIRRLKSMSSSGRGDSSLSTSRVTPRGSDLYYSGRQMPSRGADEVVVGKTSNIQPPNTPTISDVLKRVRTSQMVSEILYKNPKSRYIRCPALEVGGYHWWCNVDQFISLVRKGLMHGANIAIGITGESQFFYSIAALLVAHVNFAESDEIDNLYMQAKKCRMELLLKEKQCENSATLIPTLYFPNQKFEHNRFPHRSSCGTLLWG